MDYRKSSNISSSIYCKKDNTKPIQLCIKTFRPIFALSVTGAPFDPPRGSFSYQKIVDKSPTLPFRLKRQKKRKSQLVRRILQMKKNPIFFIKNGLFRTSVQLIQRIAFWLTKKRDFLLNRKKYWKLNTKVCTFFAKF